MDAVPYTERRNPKTTNVDVDTAEGIVDLLHECNMEVFDGYETYQGLSDEQILSKLDQFVALVRATLQNDKGIVVVSGCGTSGRIGFLACAFFNQLCREQNLPAKYRYIIAGGNSALVTSIEASEDDPVVGAKELKDISEGFEHVLFVGITCGLSAPFVGGQLEYCLDNPQKFTPVLIGFNPIPMARRIRVPKWPNNRTFHDIASRMETASGVLVINPVIGPEPISGSSRMKGGSATKVILDIVFYLASTVSAMKASEVLEVYKEAVGNMEIAGQDLATVVEQAGECLMRNACIRYVGASTFGIWGMIDASECVPTYNSAYNDIRGFMANDYFRRNLDPEPPNAFVSPALSEATPADIGKTFENLPPASIVVFIDDEYRSQKTLAQSLQQKGHQVAWIKLLSSETYDPNSKVQIVDLSVGLPSRDATMRHCLAEIILKLALNTISTGAHIMKGKVFENIMIDVRVSNIKLFYRAIDIIKSLSGVDQETAERCLIQSIHQTDEAVRNLTTKDHIIAVSSNHDHIVPIALLMCLSNSSYAQAKSEIDKCPRIRDICAQPQQSRNASA